MIANTCFQISNSVIARVTFIIRLQVRLQVHQVACVGSIHLYSNFKFRKTSSSTFICSYCRFICSFLYVSMFESVYFYDLYDMFL
jgi:hypothetical protein